jgi:hypothetical protein
MLLGGYCQKIMNAALVLLVRAVTVFGAAAVAAWQCQQVHDATAFLAHQESLQQEQQSRLLDTGTRVFYDEGTGSG